MTVKKKAPASGLLSCWAWKAQLHKSWSEKDFFFPFFSETPSFAEAEKNSYLIYDKPPPPKKNVKLSSQ